jgi:mannose-6-phosphate isomerase-like protein (cupin superfamily)
MTNATSLFNWNDLPREQVRPGVERCAFRGQGAITVFNWIQPGNEVRPHKHTFEQLVYILQGTARYHVGDVVHECPPGSMLTVPAGVTHFIEVVGSHVCLNMDVFAPVREDYMHLVDYQGEFDDESVE